MTMTMTIHIDLFTFAVTYGAAGGADSGRAVRERHQEQPPGPCRTRSCCDFRGCMADHGPVDFIGCAVSDPSQGLGPGGKKNDAGKLRWDLLPRRVLGGIVAVLTYGAKTYADDSWQQVPNGLRRYLAAQERHLNDRLRGELYDKESNLLHAYHYGTNALFVTYKLAFCPAEVAELAEAYGYDSHTGVDV